MSPTSPTSPTSPHSGTNETDEIPAAASATRGQTPTAFGVVAYASTLLAHGYGAYALGLFGTPGVSGLRALPPGVSARAGDVALDLALLLLFGLHHSVMARAAVKARLLGPRATLVRASLWYRDLYVVWSSALFLSILVLWRPLPVDLWRVETPAAHAALLLLGWIGIAILVVSTFAHDHFALFGLRPDGSGSARLSTPQLYRWVRHPMMTGLLIALWSTPDMSGGRLLLAAGLSLYIVIGVHFEERDLQRRFGAAYDQYRRRVGRFVPRGFR